MCVSGACIAKDSACCVWLGFVLRGCSLDCALCLEACRAAMVAQAPGGGGLVGIGRGSRTRRGTARSPSVRRFGRLALRRIGSGRWARTLSLSLSLSRMQHAAVSGSGRRAGVEDSKNSGHCDEAGWQLAVATEDVHARLRHELLLREMHKTLDDVFFISHGVIHLKGGTFIV